MAQLILDTSREVALGALWDGKVVASFKFIHENKLSERLLPEIKNLVTNLKSLSSIAVGIGPGSYAGTRSAVAIAQALAFGLKIPVYGFCSLLTYLPKEFEGPFSCLMPAKKGDVYLLQGVSGKTVIIERQGFISLEEAAAITPVTDGACLEHAALYCSENRNFPTLIYLN